MKDGSTQRVKVTLKKQNYNRYPGRGITVKPARATWNTGYFQEDLIRKALETLGYMLKPTKELRNSLFYKRMALGEVDYWANGWFPHHWSQVPMNFKDKAGIYGTVAENGGLQGYLVSRDLAERYNITSLDDFKRTEVKRAFDTNSDGKADLVACPPGWGCEKVITHHLSVYNLHRHINELKSSYSANMRITLDKFRRGQPVFFYTWAPNWTIAELKPGRDVVWINVPEIRPTSRQRSAEHLMTVSGLKGAVTDPVKLGFIASNIKIVANHQFMRKNPPIKAFFSVFSLPLEDINEQNKKMKNGENSQADIRHHVDEWIADNRDTWNNWLEAARSASK